MSTYRCQCGRFSWSVPENCIVTSTLCGDCPEVTVERTRYRWDGMAWWERLDEWQHEVTPDGARHPHLSYWWYLTWRPFCNWRDRRYGWPD